MTGYPATVNSGTCATVRIRPVVDAAMILVVSLCVAILRIIGLPV